MRLLVLEIEEQPNCWPSFCKAFPKFNRQLGNRTMQKGSGRSGQEIATPGSTRLRASSTMSGNSPACRTEPTHMAADLLLRVSAELEQS